MSKLKPYPEYPWLHHCVMLLPLFLYIVVSGSIYGFWGSGPYALYRGLRESYPSVTNVMRFISNNHLSIYAVYLAILIRALFARNKWDLQFILRSTVFALLFATLLTEILKGSFGFPCPSLTQQTWEPARPFQFSGFRTLAGYRSFPSGHAGAIITAALPLAFWIGRKSVSVILSLLLTAVCVSRLWLAAHHPVDILGSIVVGSLASRCIFQPRNPR